MLRVVTIYIILKQKKTLHKKNYCSLITLRSQVQVLAPQPKDKYLQFQRLWVFFYACKLVAIMLKNGDIMLNWVKIG